MSLRVLIADDHAIVRDGLKALLETDGIEVIAEASDGLEAVRQARELTPDVAVLDLAMPQMNGITAAREIAGVAPRTRVVLLTVHTERQYVIAALRGGVHGYVIKSQAAADLLHAIEIVTRGETYLSPSISEIVVAACKHELGVLRDPLSVRERQVLQLIAEGKTTKEVARTLGISVKTAESHRTRIMGKLDIHETASLVRYAIREGFTSP